MSDSKFKYSASDQEQRQFNVQAFNALSLLRRLAAMLPDKDTLVELHADDLSYGRKYPVTLTDNFMLEIHNFLETL